MDLLRDIQNIKGFVLIMKKLLVMLSGVIMFAISGCFPVEGKFVLPENAVLLDVRTPEEHKEGYLAGAMLIPLAELDSKIADSIPAKDTPVYIYCRSGRRSGIAVEKLKSQGYKDVHNLGGLNDARSQLGLPVKK